MVISFSPYDRQCTPPGSIVMGKLIGPLAWQLASEDLLANRRDGNGNTGDLTERTRIGSRRNHQPVRFNSSGFAGVHSFNCAARNVDALDLVGNIDGAGVFRARSEEPQNFSIVHVAVPAAEYGAHKIVTAKLGDKLPDVIHGQQLDADTEGLFYFIAPLKPRPVLIISEEQITTLAEVNFRGLLVETDAVLRHRHINGGHVLLPYTAHRKRARGELIAGITFDDNDGPGEAIAFEIPRDAGTDDPATHNHDIRG